MVVYASAEVLLAERKHLESALLHAESFIKQQNRLMRRYRWKINNMDKEIVDLEKDVVDLDKDIRKIADHINYKLLPRICELEARER